MQEANIRVFLDEEELHVGKEIADELPVAIEKSKIYIPIFSKGYASSAWCLRELAHMVDCKKSKPSEKEIMPIFYDVKPRDVKLKSQRYVSALEEHEEKFGRETRQKWEDALKSVAQIKGWELKKQGHWKFIQSVLQEIVMKMKTKDKYVTEHLVGMDDPKEAVRSCWTWTPGLALCPDKLKISYNALNHEQQQIFLDIACLFVDKDKTNALYMWKDCGFRPDHSIQVLVCMSLIKITDHNKFWMHDQPRDLGRKIVHGDTRPTNPRKQSRLWDLETADNIIGTKERKKHIEAICLWETRVYTSKEFSRLPNIRFLMLVGGNFSGDFENHFSELRYMTRTGVSREFLAINFHPSNLVVLELSYSSITEEWAGWSQFKVAKKLKVLDISHCSNMTRTPNFSDYLSLERLNLEDCKKLTEVDGSLKSLSSRILYHSKMINANCPLGWKEVQLDRLEQLVEFDVDDLDLEGFSGLSNLKRLKRLTLYECQNLTAIQGLGSLDSLEQLDISICPKIGSLDDLSNLKKLKSLRISNCEVLQAVKGLDELETLATLDLVNCDH
ncbi:TMV resistance protein N-like [Eucalyptus grandis]|uniref:TMV resistance protein N-like n=1 Tax=Eucalyptus grandis TaxID=71139 RepID=UPI00192EF066|nr:TMV resistance protein N-like [Eucalyptus grandis]